VSFVKIPANAQGSSGFFINTFQILPDIFRHMVAILMWSGVPYKLPKLCSVLWACADNPHMPITQNTAWVAYRAHTTP
jgi:hypothetical protein